MPSKIEFKKIPLPSIYKQQIYSIYYVVENNRSEVIEKFRDLGRDTQDDIKDLICKMATIKNFLSEKIRYKLQSYDYGEIKPRPHRFFFFQKCGHNIIFFAYVLKKRNSFNNNIYKEINKKKERYEKEFEKFIRANR